MSEKDLKQNAIQNVYIIRNIRNDNVNDHSEAVMQLKRRQ